jgi:hypothetical protein
VARGRTIPLIDWEWRIRIARWLAGLGVELELGELRHFVVERWVVEEAKDFAERRDAVKRAAAHLKRGLKRRPVIALLAGSRMGARRACKAITDFPA